VRACAAETTDMRLQEDAELIAMASHYLSTLGVTVELRINSLGDAEGRAAYVEQLTAYLNAHIDALTPTSRERVQASRALRVLDSSEPSDIEVVRRAPSLLASLDARSRARFDAVRRALGALGVAHTVDDKLVRGLDYYQHTIFEFVADNALGRQQRTVACEANDCRSRRDCCSQVLAGGRYDGLVSALGGQSQCASCGWAAGVERLALLMQQQRDADADAAAAATTVDVDPTLIAVVAARSPKELVHDVDDGDDDGVMVAPTYTETSEVCVRALQVRE
jgi:histidyl-tRNA synthetase